MFLVQRSLPTQFSVDAVFAEFTSNIVAALPRVANGLLFLVLAAAGVKVIMFATNGFLARTLPGESPVYRQFVSTVVAVFLWFAVLLSFLSVVGLGGIAAALGTSTGFVALGVSYALSGMIADAVAGVYLLRDPDFMPGDRISAGDTTGVIRSIELRKTRFDVDGDVRVMGNADIERRWTKLTPGGGETTVETTVEA